MGPVLDRLYTVRRVVHAGVPSAEEITERGMLSFVLYEDPMHFGALKDHLGLHPVRVGFAEELAAERQRRGPVQLPFEHSLPLKRVARIMRLRSKRKLKRTMAKGLRAG